MINTSSNNAAPSYRRELDAAANFARQATAASTRLAYASDLKDFLAYCADRDLCPLPARPETLAAYLASLVDRIKLTSIRRRLVAISQNHKLHGYVSPTAHPMVRAVLKGIARDPIVQLRSRPKKKTALTIDRLRVLLDAIGADTLRKKRDRAIILVGWAAALRRSELAALDVEDLLFETRGVTLSLRSSKTDPYGCGCLIEIPYVLDRSLCPVTALTAWLTASFTKSGPLFRTFGRGDSLKKNRIAPIDVARSLKRAAVDGTLLGDFSGHSLRRGYITSAIRVGTPTYDLMQRTRHKSQAVFNGYIEESLAFVENPLGKILCSGTPSD